MTFSHDVHLCDWTKGESITVLGGGPGSANFHQVQIPLYSLDGKGSTSGRLGRQGGAGHAIFKLFGTALSERKRSYAHLLTCCYCCCSCFKKAL